MIWIDLYSGSCELSKRAEKFWINIFSVDWTNYPWVDLQIDIWNLQHEILESLTLKI